MAIFDDLLAKIGLNIGQVERIRLSRGVLGRISIIAIAAIAGLSVVAWKLSEQNRIIAIGVAIFLVFLFSFVGILWYAKTNPQTALLEGAELIQWKQIELAIKGITVHSPGPIIPGAEARAIEKETETKQP